MFDRVRRKNGNGEKNPGGGETESLLGSVASNQASIDEDAAPNKEIEFTEAYLFLLLADKLFVDKPSLDKGEKRNCNERWCSRDRVNNYFSITQGITQIIGNMYPPYSMYQGLSEEYLGFRVDKKNFFNASIWWVFIGLTTICNTLSGYYFQEEKNREVSRAEPLIKTVKEYLVILESNKDVQLNLIPDITGAKSPDYLLGMFEIDDGKVNEKQGGARIKWNGTFPFGSSAEALEFLYPAVQAVVDFDASKKPTTIELRYFIQGQIDTFDRNNSVKLDCCHDLKAVLSISLKAVLSVAQIYYQLKVYEAGASVPLVWLVLTLLAILYSVSLRVKKQIFESRPDKVLELIKKKELIQNKKAAQKCSNIMSYIYCFIQFELDVAYMTALYSALVVGGRGSKGKYIDLSFTEYYEEMGFNVLGFIAFLLVVGAFACGDSWQFKNWKASECCENIAELCEALKTIWKKGKVQFAINVLGLILILMNYTLSSYLQYRVFIVNCFCLAGWFSATDDVKQHPGISGACFAVSCVVTLPLTAAIQRGPIVAQAKRLKKADKAKERLEVASRAHVQHSC